MMGRGTMLDRISRGRTDLVFELLREPDWRDALAAGPVSALQWFVYYDDVTALKAALEHGDDLASLDLDAELGNAAFFGHWKICDLLISQGADVNSVVAQTGEAPLHSALAKAGRPYYMHVLRLLLDHGADVNVRTIPGGDRGVHA